MLKELKEQKEELKEVVTTLWNIESQTRFDSDDELKNKLLNAWVLIDEVYTTLFDEEY